MDGEEREGGREDKGVRFWIMAGAIWTQRDDGWR